MKMQKALDIINGKDKPKGFMVSFEWARNGLLISDSFPDLHAGEPLIPTEIEAWKLAKAFAEKTYGKAVYICVVDAKWIPVKGYKEKMIINRGK